MPHEMGEMEGLKMTLSARNQISGEVTHVETDGVTAEVQIALAESETITAVITDTSVDELNIAEGETVTAVIKATEVMIDNEE